MGNIGLYRYRTALSKGTHEIPLYKNGALEVTHTAIVKPYCEGQKILKYLDNNGQYRYYPFNKFFETKDTPKLIGTVGKIITSILDSQSNSQNIGYDNERVLSLTADEVSEDELILLAHLWHSPRVYLYVGTTGNEDKDWVEVTVINSDSVLRRRKGVTGSVNVSVLLPKFFTVKMI